MVLTGRSEHIQPGDLAMQFSAEHGTLVLLYTYAMYAVPSAIIFSSDTQRDLTSPVAPASLAFPPFRSRVRPNTQGTSQLHLLKIVCSNTSSNPPLCKIAHRANKVNAVTEGTFLSSPNGGQRSRFSQMATNKSVCTATSKLTPSDTTQDPPKCHVLALPPELRNRIYDFTFESDAKEPVDLLCVNPPTKAILLTCRIINKEASSMQRHAYVRYWSTTAFHVTTDLEKHIRSPTETALPVLSDADLDHITNMEESLASKHDGVTWHFE